MNMITILEDWSISDQEISFDFIKSTGPGGQNVNKVATAVRLRFDLLNNHTIPSSVKSRLYKIAQKRISKEGVLTITARKHRRQEKNRQEALDKLKELLIQSSRKPKTRKKTNIPKASKQQRLQVKKHRGRLKQLRRAATDDV